PALRSRSLGRGLATARGSGRHDHRAICRRLHRRLRTRSRSPILPGGDASAATGVLAVAASREDPAYRVWTLCGEEPQAAWARQTGDLQLPGLHLHLRQIPSGQVPDQADDPAGPHAGEAQGDQKGTAASDASVHPATTDMAEAGREGLLQLPRSPDE